MTTVDEIETLNAKLQEFQLIVQGFLMIPAMTQEQQYELIHDARHACEKQGWIKDV